MFAAAGLKCVLPISRPFRRVVICSDSTSFVYARSWQKPILIIHQSREFSTTNKIEEDKQSSSSSSSYNPPENPRKKRRLLPGMSLVVDGNAMSLNDEVVQEYKQALAESNEAKGDLELDRALKDEKIEDLIESLNDVKNERDGLQHDLESKDEKIKELEIALKAKDDEKEGKSADAALQNENDKLKTRLSELLMQLECAKMNISLKGER